MATAAAELDATFAALANPIRRELVDRLVAGERSVSDLAGPLPISLQGVSQHLQILEAARLVVREKRGRTNWCRLDGRRLGMATAWLQTHEQAWKESLDAFAAYADRVGEGQP